MNGRTTARDIAAILLTRCAAEIAINPLGDFPLNDDWAWGRTVQAFLQHGAFHPTGWGPMSLLSHVVWGVLFCLPAGFSFTALRLAGFVASLVAGAGCYLLMREARASRRLAAVAAVMFLFNPITFALSATFMTDVPFVAVTVFSALFFARHLRSGDDHHLVIGTLFAIVAILSRQLAMVLPLAFAVAVLAHRGARLDSIVRAALPVIICYIVLATFEWWLIMSGRLPALYRPLTVGFLYALANTQDSGTPVGINTWLMALYVGGMVLPVLLAIIPHLNDSLRSSRSRMAAAAAGIGLLLVSIQLISTGRLLMPLSGNIIVAQGIGPLTLRDAYIMLVPNLGPLPARFWEVVTVASVVGAELLVVGTVASVARIWRATRAGQLGGNEAVGLFFLACAGCLLVPVFAEGFFDRYLVPPLPFVAAAFGALIVQQSSKKITASRLTLPVILLAVFAGFSVAGTRDYLTWNRVRWALLDEVLTGRLATPRQIDGGFEFNAWHLYDPSYVATPDKSWWWVEEDTFLVAFGPIPGWEVVRERRFMRWLPPGEGRIVLLTRTAGMVKSLP